MNLIKMFVISIILALLDYEKEFSVSYYLV